MMQEVEIFDLLMGDKESEREYLGSALVALKTCGETDVNVLKNSPSGAVKVCVFYICGSVRRMASYFDMWYSNMK